MIREGFFRNYELAQLPPLARILFQGLWCLADKNGRLKDRPQQIKAECLPYDDCDVELLLSELTRSGFILRYTVTSERFIQVINFEKHQILTSWEKGTSADIPAPQNFNKTSKRRQNRNEVLQQSFSSASPLNRDEMSRDDQSSSDQNSSDQSGVVGSRTEARSPSTRSRVPDEQYLIELQNDPAYQKLNVNLVHAKMVRWCKEKGKQPTRARLINWLNREDQPISGNGSPVTATSKVDHSLAAVNRVIAQKEAERDASTN